MMSTAPNYQSDSYFIVANKLQCLTCFGITTVFAFPLPGGIMPFYIRRLSPNAIEQVNRFTQGYRLDKDQSTGETYWMNHCDDCGAQIDEVDIFEDSKNADGPFSKQPFEGAERLQVQEFTQPFHAWADNHLNFWLLTPAGAVHRRANRCRTRH